MAFFNESNSASADKCSAKNNRRNEKSSSATGAGKKSSGGLNFRRFFFPSCSVALLVVAIYMLLLKITPLDNKVMAQIQARNLSELNENRCFRKRNSDKNASSSDSDSDDDALSGFDEIDLGENEEDDAFDSDKSVEEKYEEKNDLINADLPNYNEPEMIFVSDVTQEELNELINNMEEFPSKNEIIKMWKRSYALEVQGFYEMINGLFEYFEELKEKHQVEEEHASTQWSNVISIFYNILSEREEYYIKLFYGFIMKDQLSKEEFVNFLNNCKKETAELKETLITLGKGELDAEMIPKKKRKLKMVFVN
ncbi:hypothetical protein PCYB_121030 [Plasmodium cynomolgi strain B]|uniref:Plasmodium RESA N-terminal domain-containing protein n=1 Tax=Plasmodium cynomolgi (strain B) TaxID=1120755 RepID=K6UYB3_PLACD|nr:hypothetical protein PCYB_121030 [Plasmodium cynomolgi strain B]GAB67535.1 hypothetical protein PCYB_121030 [Plasmodium cynomolgi strain B]